MPRYRVKQKGFFDGVLYKPEKRNVLHTEKPFPSVKKVEQVPSWLERIVDETPAQKKKREAAEVKAAEKQAEESEEQKVLTDTANFMEGPKSTVETLG